MSILCYLRNHRFALVSVQYNMYSLDKSARNTHVFLGLYLLD